MHDKREYLHASCILYLASYIIFIRVNPCSFVANILSLSCDYRSGAISQNTLIAPLASVRVFINS
jgi:hypothetical protein